MLKERKESSKEYIVKSIKDFGEIFESEGKEGLINTLLQSKQFSEFELLI